MKMPWGKFKGEEIEDIPSGYLYWLAQNCEDDRIATAADEEYRWRTDNGQGLYDELMKMVEEQAKDDTERISGMTKYCKTCGQAIKGRKRTLRQNAYYWGVVIEMLAQEFGYQTPKEKEYLHETLRGMFLKKTTFKLGKIEREIPQSTTELSTVEFTDYLEMIWRYFAEEYNIYIPDPEQAITIE